MRLLSLDTSSNLLSVALADNHHVVISKAIYMERGQGEALAPLIQSMFETVGWDIKSVNQVLVAVGPGSFTGVRIGLSAARGLGLALNIPVNGISNFNAVLPLMVTQPVCVALDTKRGDCFVQRFDETGCLNGEPQILSVDDIVSLHVPVITDKADLFTNTNVALIAMPVCPAEHMIDVFFNRPNVLLPAEPLYLREADVTLSSRCHVK